MVGCSRGVGAETGGHGFLLKTSMWLLDPDMELLTGKNESVLLLLPLEMLCFNCLSTFPLYEVGFKTVSKALIRISIF